MTLVHELKALEKNEQLKALDNMNDSRSGGHDFRCYELLKAVDDMNNYWS